MEEEIKDKKIPGFVFSTFLFLFFYYLLKTICQDVIDLRFNMIDAAIAEGEPLVQTIIFAVFDIVMLGLSFWSIIKVLKGSNDAIPCIRWALVINLFVQFYQLIKNLGSAILISWYYVLLPILQIVFSIVFIVYLFRSKHVKKLFPILDRSYYLGGWMWLLYFISFIAFFILGSYPSIKKDRCSKTIKEETLSIPRGCYSDGLIMFKSDDSLWVKSKYEIYNIEDEGDSTTLWKLDLDSAHYLVFGATSKLSRHSDFMNILLQSRPPLDSCLEKEIVFCDTLLSNEQYYLDQYLYKDSSNYVWTFSVRFDSMSNKYCTFSKLNRVKNPSLDLEEAIDFLKNVEFDLNPYTNKYVDNN